MSRGLGGVFLGFTAAALFMPFLSFADADVEARVREAFADVPVMIPIAGCESGFRQFDGGATLRGGAGNTMIGVYQISEGVHASYAEGLGMDIYSLDGNLAYARYLYDHEGTRPWLSSASCWGAKAADAGIGGVARPLSLGMEGADVLALQRALNASGFLLASEGPGSPGNETTRFGALTRAAVRAFQCARGIACDGDESSTGYGSVGALTRAALARSETPSNAASEAALAKPAEPDARVFELQAQIRILQERLAELMATRSS